MLPNRVVSSLPSNLSWFVTQHMPYYLITYRASLAEFLPWRCLPQLLTLVMLQAKPGRSLVGILSAWRMFIVSCQGESLLCVYMYTQAVISSPALTCLFKNCENPQVFSWSHWVHKSASDPLSKPWKNNLSHTYRLSQCSILLSYHYFLPISLQPFCT